MRHVSNKLFNECPIEFLNYNTLQQQYRILYSLKMPLETPLISQGSLENSII